MVIVNDYTKSEIDDVMRWLSGLDLDTPTATTFASMTMKIIIWASLTGHELIFKASKTHVQSFDRSQHIRLSLQSVLKPFQ